MTLRDFIIACLAISNVLTMALAMAYAYAFNEMKGLALKGCEMNEAQNAAAMEYVNASRALIASLNANASRSPASPPPPTYSA